MAKSQDTEITLGTGKMLALFFGLVALCAVFFAMGFKMGKGSDVAVATGTSAPVTVTGGGRTSAAKSSAANSSPVASDVAFYKSAAPKANTVKDNLPPADSPDPMVPPATSGYYVQVAAVSKHEDGDALVEALKKKQYPAVASTGVDKLYHVQVGPFEDIKSAEEMRVKLMNDGYNPIVKK